MQIPKLQTRFVSNIEKLTSVYSVKMVKAIKNKGAANVPS